MNHFNNIESKYCTTAKKSNKEYHVIFLQSELLDYNPGHAFLVQEFLD